MRTACHHLTAFIINKEIQHGELLMLCERMIVIRKRIMKMWIFFKTGDRNFNLGIWGFISKLETEILTWGFDGDKEIIFGDLVK